MALEVWRARRGLARSPFAAIEREMDEWFDRFFRGWTWPRWTGQARGWTPPVDMVERTDEILVRADLPGLEQKDIEVTAEEGVLTIRGERKEEKEAKEAKDEDYYCCERWSGSFSRSLVLPMGIDAEKIKATFRNGVLEVHLPKTKEAKGKKIDVKVE